MHFHLHEHAVTSLGDVYFGWGFTVEKKPRAGVTTGADVRKDIAERSILVAHIPTININLIIKHSITYHHLFNNERDLPRLNFPHPRAGVTQYLLLHHPRHFLSLRIPCLSSLHAVPEKILRECR